MEHYSLSNTIELNRTQWEIWKYDPGSSQLLDIFSDKVKSIQVGGQNVQANFSFQSSNCEYSYTVSPVSYWPGDQSSELSIKYTFPVRRQAFVRRTVDLQDGVDITNYGSISFWVKGDNSSNNMWLDLRDEGGREVGIVLRNLRFVGWKNMILSINDFTERGIDATAIKQLRVSIDNNAEHTGSGSVTFAHLALLS
jgi:hypothetical protein